MANELNIDLKGRSGQTSGLTVAAQIHTQAFVQVGSNIPCIEVGSDSYYSGSIPLPLAAGVYHIRHLSGTTVVGVGRLIWNGTKEVTELDLLQPSIN